MTKTIAVVSGATGVGKSSLVAQISTLLAQRGQRVRAIGMDRQCTLSVWLRAEIDPDEDLYVADLLKGKPRVRTEEVDERGRPMKRMATIADIELHTEVPGLTVLPEASELETDILEIAQLGGAGDVLRESLEAAPEVDVNIIDAPGEINTLSLSAIASSDEILIVISPTMKQISIGNVIRRIQQLQERTKGDPNAKAKRIAGIVPNIVPSDRDGAFFREMLQELRGEGESDGYPDLMLPEIRRQHWEPEAYAETLPLPLSYPDAKVTQDYRKLLEELDKRGVTPAPVATASPAFPTE